MCKARRRKRLQSRPRCRRDSIDAPVSIRALKRSACERFGVESLAPDTQDELFAGAPEPGNKWPWHLPVRTEDRQRLARGQKVAVIAAGLGYSFLRALVHNVLYEPPRRFKIGSPENFPEGATYLEDSRLFIFRDQRTFQLIGRVTDTRWSDGQAGNYWSEYDGYDLNTDTSDADHRNCNIAVFRCGVLKARHSRAQGESRASGTEPWVVSTDGRALKGRHRMFRGALGNDPAFRRMGPDFRGYLILGVTGGYIV